MLSYLNWGILKKVVVKRKTIRSGFMHYNFICRKVLAVTGLIRNKSPSVRWLVHVNSWCVELVPKTFKLSNKIFLQPIQVSGILKSNLFWHNVLKRFFVSELKMWLKVPLYLYRNSSVGSSHFWKSRLTIIYCLKSLHFPHMKRIGELSEGIIHLVRTQNFPKS